MRTIQVASDLHIDVNVDVDYRKFTKKCGGDILCLAGDICSCGDDHTFEQFETFITNECKKFKRVIHVAGNHEYYSEGETSMEEIKKKLRGLEKKLSNYSFLDDDILEMKNGDRKLVFVGSTLWSYIPEKHYSKIKSFMSDYDFINRIVWDDDGKQLLRRLTVEDTQEFHMDSKKFIGDILKKYETVCDVDIVLITHHKPLWDTNPNYRLITHYAFQSHISGILVQPIKLAIHGHTHETYDKTLNSGVRVVSNPFGYDSDTFIEYDDSLTFLI
jgi:predicted phosphodiesterase